MGIFSESKTDAAGELLLTPLLEDPARDLTAIQQMALITHPTYENTPCYSGFFTVNKTFNSNLFFIYAEADMDTENTPVIVYTSDFASPAFNGFLTENGPFLLGSDGMLTENTNSWHLKAHVIYFDLFVNYGFSYSTTTINKQADAAVDLYSALDQFLNMFPDLRKRDIFIHGHGPAIKYAIYLANLIHDNNKKSVKSKIKLNGLMVGNGFFDAISQAKYADNYYQLGLIDNIQSKEITQAEIQIQYQVYKGNFGGSLTTILAGIFGKLISYTGFTYPGSTSSFNSKLFNYVKGAEIPENDMSLNNMIDDPNSEWRMWMNVGDVPLIGRSFIRIIGMNDCMDPAVLNLASLLGNGYRVLFYNGQFNLYIPYTGVVNALKRLMLYTRDWITYYFSSERKVYSVNGKVAGYSKTGE